MDSIDRLLEQIASSATTLSQDERRHVSDRLRDLSISLEDVQLSAQRLLYSPYQLMALRIGCDLNLWQTLCNSSQPVTVSELSRTTHAAPLLLGRLLRYMASMRLINETDEDTFAANNVTQTFALPGYDSAVRFYFDYVGPGVARTPSFLLERGFKDIDDAGDCPLPVAHGTDLPPFLHLLQMPEMFGHFQKFMTVQRHGMPTWLDVYPWQCAAKEVEPERVFFVDVGGGTGHQCIALRKMLPDLSNRIINQDLPPSLAQAGSPPGVEMMVQDFFEPQKIQGAKIYYMRNILHDYPDHRATTILANTREAMKATPDSVLLIDEMFLGTKGVHWEATQLDINMMFCLSAIERTESLWNDLLSKSGFSIRKRYPYTERLGDCVLECVPA
ncbi:O-methyltransferase [Myriangium duriaei CBS 260.36]|uniref:O-methyltransferase n=1 Tax=Myriangium duriaei CBS 260.36 TaxID=1168546 RepID=A0A9P4IX15_9PEZI|nr:O-methyltransferase [Myriangium duriaei CBS 260.36]